MGGVINIITRTPPKDGFTTTVDTKYGSVMDYFEIFLGRMIMCRKAADTLGLQFKLIINEQQLI